MRLSTANPLFRRIFLAAWLVLGPLAASAEVEVSGFGTLGGARSDQDFIYQRYIHDGGTLNRDSLAGLQLDARLTDAWRLTLQAKVAPSTHDDNAWEPTLSWAFLSWRPSNDLLLRAGKLRLPLMLYSANSDVGTTFDFARLPSEVYSLLPTTDLKGLSFARTWLDGEREWMLEGYLGRAHTDWRYHLREDIEPLFSAGTLYLGYDVEMVGAVLSLRDEENTWRLGLHHADFEWDLGPVPSRFPYVSIAPGLGYYQVSEALPGPGLPSIDSYDIYVLTLGAEIALPRDFRLVGEYGRRRFTNATTGPDTSAAYLALLRRVGRWTPYIYCAGIRSHDESLDMIDDLNDTRVPAMIPGAASINAAQRVGSDLLSPYDQYSLAIGTSYSLSPTSKLKAEWTHTRTGRLSTFVDAPASEDSGGRQVNVFSLSYNFTF
ncbi:hypothetical protein [Thiocystis violacea]|uniref:hypothetical protein n=1 Tax=Thiocystis violacea TaxID=13725 RepID=UPI00190714D9|nr:hypothetical protein [Thiocystis violacea]